MHRRLHTLSLAVALFCAAAAMAHAQPSQGARPASRGNSEPAAPTYSGPSQSARTDSQALEFSLERATAPTILLTVLASGMEQAPLPVREQQRLASRPDRPEWVDESQDLTRAHIERIVPGVADVIVLDRGLYQGLRVGTPCMVMRDGMIAAGLIVVASTPERAAALITLLQVPTLRVGDPVRLQVFAPTPTM